MPVDTVDGRCELSQVNRACCQVVRWADLYDQPYKLSTILARSSNTPLKLRHNTGVSSVLYIGRRSKFWSRRRRGWWGNNRFCVKIATPIICQGRREHSPIGSVTLYWKRRIGAAFTDLGRIFVVRWDLSAKNIGGMRLFVPPFAISAVHLL